MEVAAAHIEGIVESVAGYVAGLFVLGCLLLLFRQAIENVVAGFIFKQGAELKHDQPILISGRPARLVRVGILKTTFYMEIDRQTKLVVPNVQLNQLTLEVKLPKHINGIPAADDDQD